ncbi:MAG: hypothetical protein RLZZ301_1226 [Bacteroidota bacterium]|jgi:NAD(P)-dependent dehydrogenase (short-subunit alcohol dehydrogenase family)
MKLASKTVIITGAGSGMGRELALQCLKKGASVLALDLHSEALAQTKELAGILSSAIHCYVLNVADRKAVEAFVQQAIEQHHAIDGVFNNAGIIQPFEKVEHLSYEAIERVMNVNFYGPLYLTKAVLPHLKSRPEAHIINTSSMGGFLPVPGQSIYGASKAAVKLFTEALYAELKNSNVKVTVVFPGAIATNITQNSGIESPSSDQAAGNFKMLSAQEAAHQIIVAVEKDAYRVCVGQDAQFLDKLVRFAPRFATNFIAKKMASLLRPD